jgi:large subunit ribosomal protein L29
MKAEEIRELTDSELEEKFNEAKIELFNLRFQLATGQLENPKKIGYVKRDIARIQTIRRERELQKEKA